MMGDRRRRRSSCRRRARTASKIERGPGERSRSADQAAQARDQGVGGGRPKRQVALAWPQVDEINRLTREKPGLFEVDAFDKHLRGCLFGKDFDNWVDLSETCGLAMADPRMTMLREIQCGEQSEGGGDRVKACTLERSGGRGSEGGAGGGHGAISLTRYIRRSLEWRVRSRRG